MHTAMVFLKSPRALWPHLIFHTSLPSSLVGNSRATRSTSRKFTSILPSNTGFRGTLRCSLGTVSLWVLTQQQHTTCLSCMLQMLIWNCPLSVFITQFISRDLPRSHEAVRTHYRSWSHTDPSVRNERWAMDSHFGCSNILSLSHESWCTNFLTLLSTQVKNGPSMWRGTSTPRWVQMWPYGVLLPFRPISKIPKS